MASMDISHTIHLSSLHTTRGFDYCDEFDMLGVLWLLPDPVNSTDTELAKMISKHGHPAIARFSLAGSLSPTVLLRDLCGPIDVYDVQSSCLQRSYLGHSKLLD